MLYEVITGMGNVFFEQGIGMVDTQVVDLFVVKRFGLKEGQEIRSAHWAAFSAPWALT